MDFVALVGFVRPHLDWHALAPELTLLAVGTLVTVADIALDDKAKRMMPTLTGVGLLATLIPILTLAADGAERSMFGGAYVVDDFSLVLALLRFDACRWDRWNETLETAMQFCNLILAVFLQLRN